MRLSVIGFAAGIAILLAFDTAHALTWKVSCNVDRGSIARDRGTYVFRTSRNHCPGGIFKQRAEISSSNISIGRKANYTFDATVSMISKSSEDFVVFQVHDARNGCAPPLSLRWRSNGTLSFDSDYTRGKGMAGCVGNRSLRGARYSGPSLKRNGTPYRLMVSLAFDGAGGFDVSASINGKPVISGTYQPSADPSFVRSKRFYLKHGVYSQRIFDYEMKSENMRVTRR